MRTYKVLAGLLTYPTAALLSAARSGELSGTLAAERLLPARLHDDLDRLIDELAKGDPLDLEERYVYLFDRSRARSLYLFEHVHGDGRERGQAMLDLRAMYASAGLELAGNELPDYLPAFLDFLSGLPAGEARQRLTQPIHILAAVGRRLAARGSRYAAVFAALESLAAEKPDEAALASLLEAVDDDPDNGAALDASWEERPVEFGPTAPDIPEASCNRMARMARNLEPTAPAGPARNR